MDMVLVMVLVKGVFIWWSLVMDSGDRSGLEVWGGFHGATRGNSGDHTHPSAGGARGRTHSASLRSLLLRPPTPYSAEIESGTIENV
jgi:hypothetical protein